MKVKPSDLLRLTLAVSGALALPLQQILHPAPQHLRQPVKRRCLRVVDVLVALLVHLDRSQADVRAAERKLVAQGDGNGGCLAPGRRSIRREEVLRAGGKGVQPIVALLFSSLDLVCMNAFVAVLERHFAEHEVVVHVHPAFQAERKRAFGAVRQKRARALRARGWRRRGSG